jgi:RNA polymerase sigma factor (sigma-70 family)
LEVSALKYSGGIGLHGRSPLLRLQSDERLVALVRRGNPAAFEVLVGRYESRLLSFCRHLLGSREDAEDVLQDVLAAAYNAMLADDRAINVRPWLYRIARNRSLNHLRRVQALGVDSMDVHLSEHGATTADKVHEREEFRLLVGDIHGLPETQRTALVLREMEALSYEQIAEAMETTVPSVKSLLVRARVSLAEAAEARLLSCEDVRLELGEVAEGLLRKPTPLVRRHLKACARCGSFQSQLKQTNRALAAILPIGPLALFRQLALTHLGHSAGSGATAAAGTSAVAGSGAAGAAGAGAGGAGMAGAGLAAGSGASGLVSAGVGAIAGKAAAGLAAAALVTAGAVEAAHTTYRHHLNPPAAEAYAAPVATAPPRPIAVTPQPESIKPVAPARKAAAKPAHATAATTTTATTTTATTTTTTTTTTPADATAPGRTDTTTVPTVLPPSEAGGSTGTDTTPVLTPTTTTTPSSATPTSTTPTSTTTTTSTTTSTTPTSTPPSSTTPDGTSTTPSGP